MNVCLLPTSVTLLCHARDAEALATIRSDPPAHGSVDFEVDVTTLDGETLCESGSLPFAFQRCDDGAAGRSGAQAEPTLELPHDTVAIARFTLHPSEVETILEIDSDAVGDGFHSALTPGVKVLATMTKAVFTDGENADGAPKPPPLAFDVHSMSRLFSPDEGAASGGSQSTDLSMELATTLRGSSAPGAPTAVGPIRVLLDPAGVEEVQPTGFAVSQGSLTKIHRHIITNAEGRRIDCFMLVDIGLRVSLDPNTVADVVLSRMYAQHFDAALDEEISRLREEELHDMNRILSREAAAALTSRFILAYASRAVCNERRATQTTASADKTENAAEPVEESPNATHEEKPAAETPPSAAPPTRRNPTPPPRLESSQPSSARRATVGPSHGAETPPSDTTTTPAANSERTTNQPAEARAAPAEEPRKDSARSRRAKTPPEDVSTSTRRSSRQRSAPKAHPPQKEHQDATAHRAADRKQAPAVSKSPDKEMAATSAASAPNEKEEYIVTTDMLLAYVLLCQAELRAKLSRRLLDAKRRLLKSVAPQVQPIHENMFAHRRLQRTHAPLRSVLVGPRSVLAEIATRDPPLHASLTTPPPPPEPIAFSGSVATARRIPLDVHRREWKEESLFRVAVKPQWGWLPNTSRPSTRSSAAGARTTVEPSSPATLLAIEDYPRPRYASDQDSVVRRLEDRLPHLPQRSPPPAALVASPPRAVGVAQRSAARRGVTAADVAAIRRAAVNPPHWKPSIAEGRARAARGDVLDWHSSPSGALGEQESARVVDVEDSEEASSSRSHPAPQPQLLIASRSRPRRSSGDGQQKDKTSPVAAADPDVEQRARHNADPRAQPKKPAAAQPRGPERLYVAPIADTAAAKKEWMARAERAKRAPSHYHAPPRSYE